MFTKGHKMRLNILYDISNQGVNFNWIIDQLLQKLVIFSLVLLLPSVWFVEFK